MTSEAESKLNARIRPDIAAMRSRTSYPRRRLAVVPDPGASAETKVLLTAAERVPATPAPAPTTAAPAAGGSAAAGSAAAGSAAAGSAAAGLADGTVAERLAVTRVQSQVTETRITETLVTRTRVTAARAAARRGHATAGHPTAGHPTAGHPSDRHGRTDVPGNARAGGRRAARPAPAAGPIRLTRRGRVVVWLAVIVGVVAVAGLVWILAVGQARAAGHVRPGASGSGGLERVVVRPGQTLWTIATAADPTADPRVVIQEIVEQNALSGTSIQVGQVLWVPRG